MKMNGWYTGLIQRIIITARRFADPGIQIDEPHFIQRTGNESEIGIDLREAGNRLSHQIASIRKWFKIRPPFGINVKVPGLQRLESHVALTFFH